MDAMSNHSDEKQLRILQGPGAGARQGHEHPEHDGEHDEHNHGREDHNHRKHQEDGMVHDRQMDLSAVREKLKEKTGKQYWRTLEELADDPQFTQLMHREFPRHASEWDDAVDRRNFLKLMGASLALAGMAGCGVPDETHIVPYVKQRDGMILGRPNFYATAMPFGGDAIGVLVESHEGRPTKLEGNPDHPSSLGSTNAFTQASILNLYDPDRAQTVVYGGEIRSWTDFQGAMTGLATMSKASNGEGFRILTGTITAPTLIAQIKKLQTNFPQAIWHQWEPAEGDGSREGGKLAFGRYLNTVFVPGKANVIVSLDADFLASGPGHIAYAKQFARRRKLENSSDTLNRLYVAEPTPTVTGSTADHRVPVRACDIQLLATALGVKSGMGGAATVPAGAEKWLEAAAAEMQKERGNCLG